MSHQLTFPPTHFRIPGVLQLTKPSLVTKDLAISRTASHGRRVVISSNLLDMFGFKPRQTRYRREVIGQGMNGFIIRASSTGDKCVYQRAYTRRRANPFETQVFEANQRLLNQALPSWTERCHIMLRAGEIVVRPRPNPAFHIRRRMVAGKESPSVFLALSSGIDGFSFQELGFRIAGLLEWRPPEARDKRCDYSESGVLTALANLSGDFPIFNEDVMRVDSRMIREAMQGRAVDVLHFSLQCDEYSTSQDPRVRQRAVASGASTRTMVFDALRLVEAMEPGVFMAECVEAFARSAECDMLRSRLRQLGYLPELAVLDSRDFGGRSRRRRAYLVASLFPGYSFPAPLPARTTPVWHDIANDLPGCRDVSHLSAHSGRRRALLTPSMTHAPCLIKSQSHQPCDALYLEPEPGRFLFPSEKVFGALNEIPESFSFAATTHGLALEQIGQSISYSTHQHLVRSVREHLIAQRST